MRSFSSGRQQKHETTPVVLQRTLCGADTTGFPRHPASRVGSKATGCSLHRHGSTEYFARWLQCAVCKKRTAVDRDTTRCPPNRHAGSESPALNLSRDCSICVVFEKRAGEKRELCHHLQEKSSRKRLAPFSARSVPTLNGRQPPR